jgi:hypothetical protein
MKQGYKSEHFSDHTGMPTGGHSHGTGFAIAWQRGPLGRDGDRIEPNGAFVEDVIDVVIDRLNYYQDSRFASSYNADAIKFLSMAGAALHARTADREKREVEGTHKE